MSAWQVTLVHEHAQSNCAADFVWGEEDGEVRFHRMKPCPR